MDKRIARTRRAIFTSVLDFTTNKDLSDVRVVKVCEDANINKSTFYLHYNSIEECVESIVESMVNGVIRFAAGFNCAELAINPTPLIQGVYEQVENYKEIIEKYSKSRISLTTTPKLVNAAVTTVCANNGILPNTKEWAKITMHVYALTGIVLDLDLLKDKESFFSAMQELFKR